MPNILIVSIISQLKALFCPIVFFPSVLNKPKLKTLLLTTLNDFLYELC